MNEDLPILERQLKLKSPFADRELLALALVHRSYLNESILPDAESNERLEYLGDAVLSLVVARRLYVQFPELPEGRLTELRSYLVKWETLAEIARSLDIGPFLRLGRGEEATGGRERPHNLARVLEAIIGAVFLDRGYRRTERWLEHVFRREFDHLGSGELAEDAKSRLQHAAQMQFGKTPRYRVMGTEGPDHDKLFTVEVVIGEQPFGFGRGRSKRNAEREAAEAALAKINLGADLPDEPP